MHFPNDEHAVVRRTTSTSVLNFLFQLPNSSKSQAAQSTELTAAASAATRCQFQVTSEIGQIAAAKGQSRQPLRSTCKYLAAVALDGNS